MNKQQLKKDLADFAGGAGVMSPQQVGKFLGIGSTATATFLQGLDHIGAKRGKRYSIDDIAAKIMKERIMGTWSE